MKSWHYMAILFVLASAVFFVDLGSYGLTDVDEGKNAEAGREMLESGDWISPTFHYEPRYKKPVFIYWLMSLSYKFFGVSEFSARLPSALFGVALIMLQYLFLAHLRGPVLGLFGALMLLLNVYIVGMGRFASTDSVLVFFTTLCLYCFWLGFHGPGRRRYLLWVSYVSIGLGMLTKGPIAVLVPLLAVVPYLTLTRRWSQFWQRGFPILGPLATVSLAVPWYAAMLMIHGAHYTDVAYPEMAGRFFSTLEGHGGTVFFFLPVLLFGFFPWSGLLPAALCETVKTWWPPRGTFALANLANKPEHERELELFTAIWVAAVFLFFSMSSTRLLHYIAPLYPAAAILTACYWNRTLTEPAPCGIRASIHLTMISGCLMGIALVSVPALYAKFVDVIAREIPLAHQIDPGWVPVVCGTIIVVGSALVGYYGLSESRRAGTVWVESVMIGLVILLVVKFGVPRYGALFIGPPQQLAYIAGLNLKPDDSLILYGCYRPSFIFYAKRKAIIVEPGHEDEIIPFLNRPGQTMILLPSRLQSKLPGDAASFTLVLERYGYSLLTNKPMVKMPVTDRGPNSPPNTHINY